MAREKVQAILTALVVTAFLAGLIVFGSRNLEHFDAALVPYTFAVLFAAFGTAYRYSMWLQRPPTALYWKRGWQVFFRRGHLRGNLAGLGRRLGVLFALNKFIVNRGRLRGLAHLMIMWGCLLAVAITFPLVFGWLHFESLPDDLNWYRVIAFGFPTVAFSIYSVFGFLIFYALVWASFLVIAGVMLALRRRMIDHGEAALQQFGEDWLPLILLFAISVTGLMMTASSTWLRGYAYDFLAILHAITVIFTLLWLPFGKLFHVFQRPAQLGVAFYKEVGANSAQAECRRCGQPYTSQMHVDDLITIEQKLGYHYELPDTKAEHYQRICPRCRRIMLGLAQGKVWSEALAK